MTGASTTRLPGHTGRRGAWLLGACLAVVVPSLLCYQTTPVPSFSNQDAAVLGWGVFLAAVAAALPSGICPRDRSTRALLAALVLLFVFSLASSLITHASFELSLLSAGILASGILALVVGACARRSGFAEPAFRALCVAFVVAGAMNSFIGILQVFAPKLVHVSWLAAPDQWGGRATGNLRQPNSLAGLLLWSMAAAVWLGEAGALRRSIASSFICLFLLVTVLTASRMGALSTLVFLTWGAFDRRLNPRTRLLLIALPLVYACFWELLATGTSANYVSFGGASRFTGTGVVATNRYGLWTDSIGLIRDHPWLGVGFGNFNFAWTLTPVAQRPESFDHAHNLIVHLAAEVGLPCTTLVLSSLVYAAWRAFRLDRNSNSDDSTVGRTSFVMIALIGVHSMLEYPLWYSFGLLPSAFLAGLCLECTGASDGTPRDSSDVIASRRPLILACIGMIFCSVFAYVDYQRVAAIYRYTADASLLSQRVDAGRRSMLFGYYGDYAAAMLSRDPSETMRVLPRSTHHVLDARLMMVWSLALDARGESDKARYLARRLEEFHFDETKSFFAPCDTDKSHLSMNVPGATHAQLPFQCLAPVHAWTYEDFQ